MINHALEHEKSYVEKALMEKELYHLLVTKRGVNIVVYSEDGRSKENRVRFTYIKPHIFMLNFASRSGKWEQTPFEGTLEELIEMVLEQFPWTLTNYDDYGE